jgi:hypothetical protein
MRLYSAIIATSLKGSASRRDSLETILVMKAAEDRLRDEEVTVRNPRLF